MIKHLISVAFVLLTFANYALADAALGMQLFREGRYTEAVAEWRRTGDADSQLGIVTAQFLGRGVPKDEQAAVRAATPLAEAGHAGAQNFVGAAFESGVGVAQNYVQAAAWYEKAAAQGNPVAEQSLGFLFAQGLGVKQDFARARILWERAAAKGIAIARENLNKLDQIEGRKSKK